MFRKYAVLLCLVTAAILIIVATALYPGGSLYDKHAMGFDWSKDFFSNLFQDSAINGMINKGRVWAMTGMAIYGMGNGLFFMHMAKKLHSKHASLVLKGIGFTIVIVNFLVATPLHDIMVTLSSTLSMLGIFYITIFIFRTKLHLFKIVCVLCMLLFYYTLFLYGVGDWGLLAIMQKLSLLSATMLVLALEYFTNAEDFKQVANRSKP